MAPVQLQNGHKNIMIEEKSITNEDFANKNVSCTVCGKIKPNDIVDLSANEIMRETLTTYYKMTKFQVKDTLSSLCVQCVYKINIQREMARTLELRLHQRTQNPPSLIKKDFIRTPELRSSRRLFQQKLSPNHCHDSASVNTKVPDPKPRNKRRSKSVISLKNESKVKSSEDSPEKESKSKKLFSSSKSEKLSSHKEKSKSLEELEDDASTTSMLEVLRERPESVLLTESGHYLSRYNSSNLPNKYLCSYCGKPYWRKDYYKKHIRRCIAKHPYAKSQACDNFSNKGTSHSKTDRNERVFYCGYCDVTKNSLIELKHHQEKHLPHFDCPNCHGSFKTQYVFDFHMAECGSRKEALDEESPPKGRHRTRSVSRALSRFPASEYESCANVPHIEDDAVSVADSSYSQRMHITTDWIDALDESSNWPLSQYGQNDYNHEENYCDEIRISSFKEYDLYLLDIFKLQVECGFFRCLENGCDYRAYELLDAILHDYKEHWNHSWYFCRKCGCMFTRKAHLDYHLYHQNSGRYICFKCTEVFVFQHELDRHLIQHSKNINYRCNYCQLEFLTELELIQHCDLEQHNPNEEKCLVQIDQSMTITNIMKATCDETRQTNPVCHSVRFIEMHLPKIPSKQSSHQQSRHIIGEFEFKNQIIPNCAGWKYED